jgi:hypothetical protein
MKSKIQISRTASTVFLLSFGIFLFWYLNQLFYQDSAGNWMTPSLPIWGDWAAHFTFVSQFQERGFTWIRGDNPLFAGVPARYPFISHAITAVFGSEPIRPVFWISAILVSLLPAALYRSFRWIKLPRAESLLAVVIFLFFGGTQYLLDDTAFKNVEKFNDTAQWTNQFGAGQAWTNFLVFEFIPQRAFLFGIIGSVAALLLARLQKNFLVFTLIFGWLMFLPAVHAHSWIAVGILLLVHAIRSKNKNLWIWGISSALASSLVFYVFILHGTMPEDYALKWDYFNPGWHSVMGLTFKYWWDNTGLLIPMVVFSSWNLFIKNQSKTANTPDLDWVKSTTIAGTIIFILAFFIQFQPFFFDNMKLFTYVTLFWMPILSLQLIAFVRHSKNGIALALVLIGSFMTSGLHDVVHPLNWLPNSSAHPVTVFTSSEINIAEKFKALRRSPEDRVLIIPKHNHWIPCLTGSKVLMGYPGWLWSWGINYNTREADLKSALHGDLGKLNTLRTDYDLQYAVFHQTDAQSNTPVNLEFFRSQFTKVLEENDWTVFDLTKPMSPVDPSVKPSISK